LHPYDIALTFMLIGFLKKINNKCVFAIDWKMVDQHMEKVKSSKELGTR